MKKESSALYTIIVVGLSLAGLVCLSFVPWSELTNNKIKDFDLFADLHPAPPVTVPEPVMELIAEEIVEEAATEIVAEPVKVVKTIDSEPKFTRIESFDSSEPLQRFVQALRGSDSNLVRIAVIGDSFIEGDILCGDLREKLQQRFGGSGVGYMAMHSDFSGFRKTIKQSDEGWEMHDVRTMSRRDTIRPLSAAYAKAGGPAKASFKSVNYGEGTKSWTAARFVFLAPDSGTIELGGKTFEVTPSDDLQCIEIHGDFNSTDIKTDINNLVALGLFLDGDNGVALDCMSVRATAGHHLASTSYDICEQMRQWVDYDLIIIEYGANALSAEQNDYTPYSTTLVHGINKLKQCYPNADILLLGAADRGEKVGMAIKSLPTTAAMVAAQRHAAHDAGVYFWDTRAAMGGEDAAAQWHKRKLMNSDYTHLNHNGGAELAQLLFEAINDCYDK